MSADPKPNRFTFRHPDLSDDRERLGDAEQAFNHASDPTQDRQSDATPAAQPQRPRFTANGMPEPTPKGTRVMRRFRFNDREAEPEQDQAEEIDFASGEWVIEFTPEEADEQAKDPSVKQNFEREI